MSLFSWLFFKPLPPHTPATEWLELGPAMGLGTLMWIDAKDYHKWTAFWEEMPDNCFSCGEKTVIVPSDYDKRIDQYMVRTCFCPRHCGYTVWIA